MKYIKEQNDLADQLIPGNVTAPRSFGVFDVKNETTGSEEVMLSFSPGDEAFHDPRASKYVLTVEDAATLAHALMDIVRGHNERNGKIN